MKSALYPKNSIRQISGVWDKLTFPVLGRFLSLDHIEHQIIRKEFHDPRIHLALVCAARGCPPLRAEAFIGLKLDAQLDDQARQFFQNPDSFRVDREKGVVYLSVIFDWFGGDFIDKYGSGNIVSGKDPTEKAVLIFISRFVSPSDRDYLTLGKFSVKYLSYDWTLNELAR